MLQDIAPHVFHNEFRSPLPTAQDKVAIFDSRLPLLRSDGGFPTVAEIKALGVAPRDLIYLFAIDERSFFLLPDAEKSVRDAFHKIQPNMFRIMHPAYLRMAGITALHLSDWYRDNRFCGRCGAPTVRDTKERAMRCTACGCLIYPRINPAVLAAVRDKDRLLLTRYAGQGAASRYALVAGFTEIGETLEGTVRREVMEEVGLHIKNIRYHASQPWGFAGNIMAGFWADLDGDGHVNLKSGELSTAVWLKRNEIPEGEKDTPSLTQTMIEIFRKGADPR